MSYGRNGFARWLRAVGIVVTALLIMASCGDDDAASNGDSAEDAGTEDGGAEGEPIKVGVIVARTGTFADYGLGEEEAVELAAEQINGEGGIDGRPIELIVRDSAGEPDVAISTMRELIEREEVAVVLGPGLTATAEPAFPVANQAEAPAISPSIVSTKAAPENRPWTFSIGAPADILFEQNFPTIESAYPDVERLALVIDPECSGCVSEAEFMADFFEENGYEVVNAGSPIAVQAGAPDLGAQATAVAELDPDAVVGSAGPGEWARLANELERRGLDIPAFSGTGPSAPEFLEEAGPAGDGWTVLSAFWEQNPDEDVQTFVAELQPALADADIFGGVINSAHALYYDAMMMVAEVLREADISDASTEDLRTIIRDGMQNLEGFEGITGEHTMQENGRMQLTGHVLVAREGEWVRLEA